VTYHGQGTSVDRARLGHADYLTAETSAEVRGVVFSVQLPAET
jgi:hypothetical protein